jgi:MerR family transcriptional regulator, light-induced transcriptional regulator
MEKLLTTKELAAAIGSSESSMRRWTNSGAIHTARTVGGHRRIALSEAVRFVRETGLTVVRPDLLGLPEAPSTAAGEPLGGRSLEQRLYEALHSGDAAAAKGCVVAMYLGGMSVAGIGDGPMRLAMERMGELWKADARGILVEHRATSICFEAIGVLRQMIPTPDANAPLTLGGAPEGDPYLLPSTLVEAVLAEAGCRTMNFGPDTPLELLAAAAQEHKASMVWVSLKGKGDRADLLRRVKELGEQLAPPNVKLLVGGTRAEELGIRARENVHVLGTLTELAAFVRGAVSQSVPPK